MTTAPSGRKPIINVRGLHKYYGDAHIIRGVDLAVRPGEVYVIAGPSGAGKSTFLRCLNFLEESSAGTIEVAGIEVDARDSRDRENQRIRAIRRQAAMVFQDFNLFPHMTVLDNITCAAIAVKKVPRETAVARAEMLLDKAGLLARRGDYPRRLSAGQQQQAAIARSLCMEPRVILFDDPTSALDPLLVNELVDTISRLKQEGLAMLIVSNEPYLTRSVAGMVIFMDGGVWQENTPPHIIYTNPQKARTRRFFEHITLKEIGGGR